MIKNKYVSPVNDVYLPVIVEWSIYYEGGISYAKRGLVMKGMDCRRWSSWSHSLSTFGQCILKVLLLALTVLHCNIQKQKGIDSYKSYGIVSYVHGSPMYAPAGGSCGLKFGVGLWMCLCLSLLAAKALTSLRISIHRLVWAFVASFKHV